MTVFNEHKVKVNDLLGVVPEVLLSHLSSSTKVDYYSKVLTWKGNVLSPTVRYFRKRQA